MKRNIKIYFLALLFIICIGFISYHIVGKNSEKIEVTLAKCIDGDTARFNINNQEKKVRFLYIDTPEISYGKDEPYGREAADFTCEKLNDANQILIEYNPEGDKIDKYERELAWIFVDGQLLQTLIAKEGYVVKYYDYGIDYLYKDEIIQADNYAKDHQLGIYNGS